MNYLEVSKTTFSTTKMEGSWFIKEKNIEMGRKQIDLLETYHYALVFLWQFKSNDIGKW